MSSESRTSTPSLHEKLSSSSLPSPQGSAIRALPITSRDTVIETADGHRLPGVPIGEAKRLNALQDEKIAPVTASSSSSSSATSTPEKPHGLRFRLGSPPAEGATNIDAAPADTDPLFPPLLIHGPPSALRKLQCLVFRASSGVLSLLFLGTIVLGAFAKAVPDVSRRTLCQLRGQDPDSERPFITEERARASQRDADYRAWRERRPWNGDEESGPSSGGGSPEDALLCDIGYYARRVGLDCETFTVETEDGFLLEMQHIWDPSDPPYYPPPSRSEKHPSDVPPPRTPIAQGVTRQNGRPGRRKYPVLLMHGLLQSAGAFCVNDSSSLAFQLCRAGYDVFLSNSRCGMKPLHTSLHTSDPRMWAWNIRSLAVLDLPAFVSHILALTAFPKLALVAHSQGTTLSFIALTKSQRPELGNRISVFCALAPAVYAGPLIDKVYFKLMRAISPRAFRIVFGIHSFIPIMMTMHRLLPAPLYGDLGYRVFNFLFGWSDTRWDRGIRQRFFRFAPVYVSSEMMRWWLGSECFAKHRCILDAGGDRPWFDNRFPKLAMWVAGSDGLVDGRRLVRRFEEGCEPEVDVVHASVIDEYEHLDVIWAMDAHERVGREVRDVIWNTIDEDVKRDVVEVVMGTGS